MKTTAAKTPLNPVVLDRLQALNQPGQADIVQELVADFLEHLPVRSNELRQACAGGSISDVVRLSHSLKSAAALLGLEVLESVCREIETHPDEGTVLLPRFDRHLADAQAALHKYLHR